MPEVMQDAGCTGRACCCCFGVGFGFGFGFGVRKQCCVGGTFPTDRELLLYSASR